jgi:hypothetical protein
MTVTLHVSVNTNKTGKSEPVCGVGNSFFFDWNKTQQKVNRMKRIGKI